MLQKMNKIVCFGETLWDLLPSGKVEGGAPMNVVVHARQLGMDAAMVSRVGADELGDGLVNFLNERTVNTDALQRDLVYETGVVQVSLTAAGSPSYTIASPAAWDAIEADEVSKTLVKAADVFVFGSLACREPQSKKALIELASLASLRVLDVNLRTPFYSQELVEELLALADFVKVNEEELALICSWFAQNEDDVTNARFLKAKYDLKAIVVTRGGDGAFFIGEDNAFAEHAGYKVTVADTIGSGDSFLASFLKKWLEGTEPAECLAYACAVGALVATRKGATPAIYETEISSLIDAKV
jgi:fructokinase